MPSKRIFIHYSSTTVTGAIYRGFIDQFVATLTEEEVFHGWFQQDNAPAHTAQATLQQLQMYFGERVISRGLWPTRSPDLTPPDYFLWGFLKEKVYRNCPRTLNDLRANITNEINHISPELLRDATNSIICRVSGLNRPYGNSIDLFFWSQDVQNR
jgi:hypothetical protein